MTTEPMMHVTVRCFAAVREVLGEDQLRMALPVGTTVGQLRQMLVEGTPKLSRIAVAFAVNRDYARAE